MDRSLELDNVSLILGVYFLGATSRKEGNREQGRSAALPASVVELPSMC
jgi:hypothetical protein